MTALGALVVVVLILAAVIAVLVSRPGKPWQHASRSTRPDNRTANVAAQLETVALRFEVIADHFEGLLPGPVGHMAYPPHTLDNGQRREAGEDRQR